MGGPISAKARLVALFNAVLGIGAGLMISLDGDPFSTLWELVAGPAMLLLGTVYLGRVFSSRPELEATADALIHRCARFPGALEIPWSQIIEAEASPVSKDVVVEVESRLELVGRAAPLRKLELLLGAVVGKPNTLRLRPPLDMTRDDFAEIITRRSLEAERRSMGLAGPEPEEST